MGETEDFRFYVQKVWIMTELPALQAKFRNNKNACGIIDEEDRCMSSSAMI